MRHRIASSLLLVVAFVVLSSVRAQAAPPKQQQGCLPYEPTIVTLTGQLRRQTFPGAPNYRSVRRGDKPEVHWVLRLSEAACTNADSQNETNVAEREITSVQLVLDARQYRRWRKLLRGQTAVVVSGTLFHQISAHHYTPVLLNVTDMRRATE